MLFATGTQVNLKSAYKDIIPIKDKGEEESFDNHTSFPAVFRKNMIYCTIAC